MRSYQSYVLGVALVALASSMSACGSGNDGGGASLNNVASHEVTLHVTGMT